MTAIRGRSPRTRWAWAAVAVLLALGFIALGSWQIARRSWKLALIEQVEQRVHAPPIAAPGRSQWPRVNAANDAYRHVRATGVFLDDAQTLVQASTELGGGFWLMTPLRTADGTALLINRGFVTGAWHPSTPSIANSEPVTVTGLLRITEPGGGFLRHNDPASNRWYSRDVVAIAAARGLQHVAPYFIDADAYSNPEMDAGVSNTQPVGGLTVTSFPNNHAVYAVTWFTLALMASFAAWRVLNEADER